jgi:para-nitrobenzyl esterase
MIDMPNVFSDGFVLPDDPPMDVLRAGRYHRVPVILGTNRDENKLFMALDPEHMWTLRGVPVWMKDEARYLREASYRSRMWKAAAVDEPAAAMRAAQGPSVFAYRFDWDELPRFLWIDLGKWLGAAHAFEIPFVFGHFDLGRAGRILWTRSGEASREALAASMMSWWAQFARTGDPASGTDGRQPRWAAWDPDGDKFLVIDTPEGGGARMASDALAVESLVAEMERDQSFADDRERCELLASLVDRTPQLHRDRLARVPGCTAGPAIGG